MAQYISFVATISGGIAVSSTATEAELQATIDRLFESGLVIDQKGIFLDKLNWSLESYVA